VASLRKEVVVGFHFLHQSCQCLHGRDTRDLALPHLIYQLRPFTQSGSPTMYSVVISICSAPRTAREHFESVYTRVFASLVSCLPGLLHTEQECQRLEGEKITRGTCTLWFPSEEEKQFALFSREWVELIDETADVLDWETVEFHAADADARDPRSELVAPSLSPSGLPNQTVRPAPASAAVR